MEKMETGEEHILMDGCPRSLPEALMIDTMLSLHLKRENPFVFLLNTSENTARRRMLNRGRPDDTPEKINIRLGWFTKDVIDAISFFKMDKGYRFFDIDGNQTPEKVFEDILKKITG